MPSLDELMPGEYVDIAEMPGFNPSTQNGRGEWGLRCVTDGTVVEDDWGRPSCVEHGAMNAVNRACSLWRCLTCGRGCYGRRDEFISPPGRPHGYVYAVRLGPYLKIGATHNPARRIKEFSGKFKLRQPDDVGEHKPEPIFALRADRSFERVLHAMFAPARVIGEFYDAAGMTWIDALKDVPDASWLVCPFSRSEEDS